MADQDDERRLKLKKMQLSINKTKAEISKLENPDSNKQESEIAKMLRRMAGEE